MHSFFNPEARFRLLSGIALATCTALAACGGSDGAAPPEAPPTAEQQGLRVVPAAVGLDIAQRGQVHAAGATSAVTWSSSDTTVVTVDDLGQLQPVGRGTAVVTASTGSGQATATVQIYDTHAAAPDPTSEALIRKAVSEGRLGADDALLYRVYAAYGDLRLPAEYRGPSELVSTTMLMREAAGRMAALAPDKRAALRPFFLPPIYAESWDAQQFGAGSAASASGAPGRVRPLAAAGETCSQMASGVLLVSTAHFNVWVVDVAPLSIRSNALSKLELASLVGSMLEDVYLAETNLLQRFPASDAGQPCNGSDGAIDIYITNLNIPATRWAESKSYPVGCNQAPGFMKLNYSVLANSTAPGLQSADTARRYLKSVIAHEMMHLIQFGMNRPAASCGSYEWIDEATAEWAMDFIAPGDDFEDGIDKVTDQRRSGAFYANYLLNSQWVAIEEPGNQNAALSGYDDYIFFQYVARKHGAQTIKAIYDAMTGNDSVRSLYAGLQASGGLEKIWHEFALVLWNDPQNGTLDNLASLDGYDLGLIHVFTGTARDASAPKPATRTVALAGGKVKIDLLKTAVGFPSGYSVQPRSVHYEHLMFDDTVSAVLLTNPLASAGGKDLKLQAVAKIGGRWKAVEDWTAEVSKFFCRDKQAERVEELILVVSNSENVPSGQAATFDKPLQLSASNVGCWHWQGTASRRILADDGAGNTGDYVAQVQNVVFEPQGSFAGMLMLATLAGEARGRYVTHSAPPLPVCDVTLTGPVKTVSATDGMLWLHLDLDAEGIPSTDRNVASLIGNTFIDSTSHGVCPAIGLDETRTFLNAWGWLGYPLATNPLSVSDDGRTIEGNLTEVQGAARIIHTFTFTAMRE